MAQQLKHGMRPINMPELPEVETVKRTLEQKLIGKTFGGPLIYYAPLIKTDIQEFQTSLPNVTITSLSRRGKFLIIHLNNNHQIFFHLRMEGKLFIVNKENYTTNHLSLFIPFQNDKEGLAFYDVRRFGVCYYLSEGDNKPLDKLGPEPFEITNSQYLYSKFQKSSKPIKEILLDQSIMSGLGNIYADEVCFASNISPFKIGKKITLNETETILKESKRILSLAIENKGSTVRTYKASESVHGEFQDFLKVYSREGKKCLRCKIFKIQKTKLNGRGTSFCPKCQHTGIAIGITGKIATGKSLVTSYFAKLGYVTFSCDEYVKKLYSSSVFLKQLEKRFSQIFTPTLNKQLLSELLLNDKQFKRNYQNFLYPIIRNKVRDFIIKNDGFNKAIEVPLLFESRIDKEMTFLLGTESNKQAEHLKERDETKIEEKLLFNNLNSYDKNRHKLYFIIKTDGNKNELYEKVKQIDEMIQNKLNCH